MAAGRTIGWGIAGAATTMAVRAATRSALHTNDGAPLLPRVARQRNSFAMMLMLAGAAGAFLALSDVLKEQRANVTQAA